MLSEIRPGKRIAEAITEAESKTSGEIFCVLAHEVSHYREVPLVWAAVAAFVLPPLCVLCRDCTGWPWPIFSSWTDESARAMKGLILRRAEQLYAAAGRPFS